MGDRLQLGLAGPFALAAALALSAAPAVAAGNNIAVVHAPAGFEDLARPRELLVDIYFGGQKIGEALAISSPGFLRFKDPEALLSFLPSSTAPSELAAAVAQELPANSALVCSHTNLHACGEVDANPLSIIFDEDRFRVDLFIAPRLLSPIDPIAETYLPNPAAPLSLTSSMGLAVSGATSGPTAYNFQNRTIVGLRNARVRADSSYASNLGLVVDDLVLEVDRPDLRYSAGLFWAPGVELIGNRRILGAGVGTQFDTRLDREALQGTPIILFLPQQSRVEVLVDGRLVGSGVYEAGNNVVETTSLPAGSYPVLLRIHEPGGRVREERRFFMKNAQVPPLGEPIYSAYAGVLANTRNGRPINLSRSFFYQLGTARRLTRFAAADLSLVGTQDNAIVQAGGWLVTSFARARVAGLLSTGGDRGLLLQLASTGRSRLNMSFDLRRIWNKSGRSLIPLQAHADTFSSNPLDPVQSSDDGYTQVTGSVGYSIGSGSLSLIGSLRKDAGGAADYSLGGDISWRVASVSKWQLMLHAETQVTRTTRSSFVGARLFWRAGPVSMLSSGGRRSIGRRDGEDTRFRGVWSVTGHYSRQSDDGTRLGLAAGIDRDLETTTAHGSGTASTPFGNGRADIVQNLEGGGTQYGLTLQTAAAATAGSAGLGGRDLAESAVILAMEDSTDGAVFDVLFDEQPRGRLTADRALTVFVQPYRRYSVRLRPVGPSSSNYDAHARDVTLYPGSVEYLRWRSEASVTVFGQAVLSNGKPVANATIQSLRGIGRSDENGYFQIDVAESDVLEFASPQGQSCGVRVTGVSSREVYARVGKVVCQ